MGVKILPIYPPPPSPPARGGVPIRMPFIPALPGGLFWHIFINPGIEFEVKEGVPIIIGMSVICLGKGCLEEVKTFLDSIDVSREISESDTGTLGLDQ